MNKFVKWGLIVFFGLPAICGIAGLFIAEPAAKTDKPVAQVEQKQEAQKQEEVSYYVLSKQLLKEYVTKKAQAAGTGVPEVDTRFVTYKDWDVDETMKVSQGTFYLGGNDKVEHSYTIRWRKKNNQVLRVEINGQKVYYDEEAQWAAMDDNKKK